jgi:hypothetical protein
VPVSGERQLRQHALSFRGRNHAKYASAKALQQFADAVTDRQK